MRSELPGLFTVLIDELARVGAAVGELVLDVLAGAFDVLAGLKDVGVVVISVLAGLGAAEGE